MKKPALILMMLFCIFLLGCAASASAAPSPAIDLPSGYALAFADEFDGQEIDEGVWNFETGPWPYNEELESYTRDNAWIEDGSLVIEARKEASEGRDYTSARLTTLDKIDFTYGYLEVRAAVPYARGTWPAIWMLPSDERYGGYLQSGEIDIMERVGHDAGNLYATIHTEQNNSVLGNPITASATIGETDAYFHTYGMLWDASSIRIFLDGESVLTYLRAENATSASWPFDVPFHIILNLALGGTWGGETGVDDAALPQRMYVDYVRLYTNPADQE